MDVLVMRVQGYNTFYYLLRNSAQFVQKNFIILWNQIANTQKDKIEIEMLENERVNTFNKDTMSAKKGE